MADDIDKMLQDIDTGKKKPSTLKDARQTMPSTPLPRPGGIYTAPEGPRGGQIKHKDYAPKDISPHGDLGILDDKEQKAFFPNPIKNSNAEWQSSKHFPMGRVRVMGDTERLPSRMDANSTVYPQYDKGDYSGLKAEGKKATQRRGVTAKSGEVDASSDTNSIAPLVNKRQRNF